MYDLLQIGTRELARFLGTHLPALSEDWWKKHVEARLSFQQQRMVQEGRFMKVEQLDFAALLRVLDQNWYELSQALNLPREARHWVKEMQTVRNRWAHLPSGTIASSEVYRDADTLGRLLEMMGCEPTSLAAVESEKASLLTRMADLRGHEASCSAGVPTASEPQRPPPTDESVPPPSSGTSFQVGDLVALRADPSVVLPVIEVMPEGAEVRYRVFRDNKKETYYESQLQRPEGDDGVQDCLTIEALLAYLSSIQLRSPSTTSLFSLRSGRINFVPYQYRPVLKLIRADRPRLLIADEVGVGKTIEAGLIIKELRARMDIASVLIICPKALVAERKWLLEMKRFDEHFTALDGAMLRHCLRETSLDGEWPAQYEKAIVPFSLFDSDLLFGRSGVGRLDSEALLDLDPPPRFDLVIVDEAHHIRNSDTYLHQAVRYFCDNAQAAVFLTATPVQLGSNDLFSLLNVLRPDLVIDHASFEQMAAPNPHINRAIALARLARPDWQREAQVSLEGAAQTQWGRLFLREVPTFQSTYDRLGGEALDDVGRIEAIRSLEDLYTFSRLINRTRRRDIGEFTTRKPETLTVAFTPEQQQLHDDLLGLVSRILTFSHGQQNVKFMMTTLRRQAASCLFGLAPLLRGMLEGKLDDLEVMEAGDGSGEPTDLSFVSEVRGEVEALVERAEGLDSNDPKAAAFCQVLDDKQRMQRNKALVFSTFRHTLAYLEDQLAVTALRFGVTHGGVPDEERAELRRRFALPRDGTDALDVLLTSEVGCEGLDFQCCDLLVNYDLPWNPMRVEQRIGRIDRYGQESETVAIVNLVTPATVDADIYERCLWRIGVFHHAVGGSEEILGEITREIHDIAQSFSLTTEERAARLQQLGENGIRRLKEEEVLEEQQTGLFGLSVPPPSWRQEIEDAESSWTSEVALERCVSTFLATLLQSDGQFLLGDKPLKTLRLSQEARGRLLDDFRNLPRGSDPVTRQWERWLKGSEPLLSVTFDQATSVEAPGAIHLGVLHPLVRQAARFLDRSDPVRVSLSVESDALPRGEVPFVLYRWRYVGVRPEETLVAVSQEASQDEAILPALSEAQDGDRQGAIDASKLEALELRHHALWQASRADHITENQEMVEQRVQSLRVSHQARCALLGDQVQAATNAKIRRMKESELARAELDYDRRIAELQDAAQRADIHAVPVVYGVLTVTRGSRR